MNRRNFVGGTLFGLTGLLAPAAWARTSSSPNPRLLEQAKAAMETHRNSLLHTDIIGIADYTRHSAKPRFHLVDLEGGKVSSLLVSHGKGSDRRHTGWLKSFSNVPGSEASSGGAYVTSNTYTGKHGLSQRLKGLDASNDMAEARAIVIHGAWYANPQMVDKYGKLGRSQGCFAFAESDLDQVFARLTPGHLLFAGKS